MAFLGSSPPDAEVHMVEQNEKTKLVQLGYELFTFYIIYFCCVLIVKLHPSFFFLSLILFDNQHCRSLMHLIVLPFEAPFLVFV